MTKHISLEQHMKIAAETCAGLFSIQGAIYPMLHTINKDGEHMLLAAPGLGGDDAEKDSAAAAVRKLFKERNIVQYVFICEAWFLELKEFKPSDNIPRPSSHPNRVEIIALSGEDESGEMTARMRIMRPDGKKPYLEELADLNRPDRMEGRFVGFLPTKAAQ